MTQDAKPLNAPRYWCCDQEVMDRDDERGGWVTVRDYELALATIDQQAEEIEKLHHAINDLTATTDKVWDKVQTVMDERAEAQFQLSMANATIERLRGESCEHCGCALLPRQKEPVLCESCLGVCSDDCDHRHEEDDPNVCGKVRKVTLELHADERLSCTFHTCCVSWDEMMSAVARFRDKLNWEIENAAKCPVRPITAVVNEAAKEPK